MLIQTSYSTGEPFGSTEEVQAKSWEVPILSGVIMIVSPSAGVRSEKLPGGWGVMADDVIAGIMAYFILLLFYYFTS